MTRFGGIAERLDVEPVGSVVVCLVVAAIASACVQGRPTAADRPHAAIACDVGTRRALASFAAHPLCSCGDERTCAARCEAGDAGACGALGGCYGTKVFGTAPDKMFEYSARGCDLGDPLACTNLGTAYATGLGTEPALERAQSAFARAVRAHRVRCDAGDAGSCYMMSNAYDMGKGVIRDDVVATTYLTRACTLANGFACLRLASKSREANDPVASATFVALACEHSCGVFCPPDEAAAENDFGLAAAREYRTWRERCDRGNATICEPR